MEIEKFVTRLLHAEDEISNKLVDLLSSSGMAFYLKKEEEDACLLQELHQTVKEKIGKTATTVLLNSALTTAETLSAPNINTYCWNEKGGVHDVKRLDAFYKEAQRLTTAKGDNPAFLALGALRWQVPSGTGMKEILSPLIIYPVRMIRSGGNNQPITIEFIDDDVFFNPALVEKLKNVANADFANTFPLPTEHIRVAVDVATFDIDAYLTRIEQYLQESAADGRVSPYRLERIAVVSMYNNPDISMYRDYERNKERIDTHPVVRAMFGAGKKGEFTVQKNMVPPFVLDYDAAQYKIVSRVLSGENLVVQGPPGTGKTQTIANMIACLLSEGKKVLFSSKKTSALAEVYNKMPEELQPYLLRLDYETEAETAKIDTKSVHRALQASRLYHPVGKENDIVARRQFTYEKKFASEASLNAYRKKMFIAGVSGEDLYSAILGYTKNSKIEFIPFELPQKAFQTTKQEFLGALETVNGAANAWAKLTDGEKIPIRYNPWYSVKPEAALREGTQVESAHLKEGVTKIFAALEEVSRRSQAAADLIARFRLSILKSVAECPLTEESAKGILKLDNLLDLAAKLKRFSIDIRVGTDKIIMAQNISKTLFDEGANLSALSDLLKIHTASNLDHRLLNRVVKASHIYNDKKGVTSNAVDIPLLLNALRMYATSLAEATQAADAAGLVFESAVLINKTSNERLTAAYDALKKYIGTGASEPKFFDFRGKRHLKVVQRLAGVAHTFEFSTALHALQRVQAFNYYTNQSAKSMDKVRAILECFVTEEEATDLLKLLESFYHGGSASFKEEIRFIFEEYPKIEGAIKNAGIKDCTPLSVGALTDLYLSAQLKLRLVKEFAELRELFPTIMESELPEYYARLGQSVEALEYLRMAIESVSVVPVEDIDARAEEVISFGIEVRKFTTASNICPFITRLTAFYEKNFTDSVYQDASAVAVKDFKWFKEMIEDKSNIAAATKYRTLLQTERRLNVAAFFRPFQSAELSIQTKYSFVDIFEHSFYALVIDAIRGMQGDNIHGLTRDNVEEDLKKLSETERELLSLNAKRIAFLCASRVQKEDTRFDFLKVNTQYTACRRLFADRAPEILKLKPCFIVSPSTASLLLRAGEFWDFDVAIIDEASQIPPEYVLGIAARAKQCVVVGDENQMPPIKHFVHTIDGGAEEGLEAIESALELLKQSDTFAVLPLVGHFRSMTESLISYSQKRYYPEMVTFPAVLPRSIGLGLYSVYCKNGCCTQGENEVEAEAVVKALAEHFNAYYDEETHALKKSVGVVTFGQKQSELVRKKIGAEKELSKKIRFAEEAAGVAEKAFFVRTIETVQGQETDALILSVTYGKSKKGIYQNFGQLNGRLGERIFNVAVTRAKSSVTVIHSILSAEIDAAAILYIKDYLREVEIFDNSSAARQFVSSACPNPLQKSVAKVLSSVGIDKGRIVFDYGVTENSVKIPIAVLNAEGDKADFGLYIENEPKGDFFDETLRYPQVLISRGWTLYRVFAFDWIRNRETEVKKLIEFAKANTTI